MDCPETESKEQVVPRKCAWCGQFMDAEAAEPVAGAAPGGEAAHPTGETAAAPQDPGPSGTICRACAARLTAYRTPVLVVSREWARLYEAIAALFKSRPDIQVLIDRRQATGQSQWTGPERRSGSKPMELK